jgi:hypothetical protein
MKEGGRICDLPDVGDLCIDFDALRRTRGNLAQVESLLRGPCSGMADLPADAAGHEVLRSRLRDFADEWDYGIEKAGRVQCRRGRGPDVHREHLPGVGRRARGSVRPGRLPVSYPALGFDPAPGSLSQGEVMARRLRAATRALEEMDHVLSGTGDQQWQAGPRPRSATLSTRG